MITPVSTSSEESFRGDINALRAYAVLAVMLFHFDVPPFSGGYVGVDVFFVISGYLMTRVILRGMERRDFSFVAFYLSRARRLLPALLALCAFLLVLGWLSLIPIDYRELGRHAASAVGFYSNFTFMDEEGYFDLPSKYKWLLHTWSLSVEWQFYLIYPLVLALAYRFNFLRRHLFWVLVALVIASLVTSVIGTSRKPVFGFYMLPPRFWELCAGGLIYLLESRIDISDIRRRWMELSGFAAILVSCFVFDSFMLWPSGYALLPVAGTMLVLLAHRQRSIFTGSAALQHIGLWSYSIYLWHWPIVAGKTFFDYPVAPYWQILGFVAALLLGAASYRFIEQPARSALVLRHRIAGSTVLAGSAILLLGAGLIVNHALGYPSRVTAAVLIADQESKNDFMTRFRASEPSQGCGFSRSNKKLTPCIFGDRNDVRAVVWGDSHSGTIVSAVRDAVGGGVVFFQNHCVTIFGAELRSRLTGTECTDFNAQVLEAIKAYPPEMPVIILNRYMVNVRGPNEGSSKPWGIIYQDVGLARTEAEADRLYRERMVKSLCTIAAQHKVYAVLPVPEIGVEVPRTLARDLMRNPKAPDLSIPYASYLSRNEIALQTLQAARDACGVTLLPTPDYVCDGKICPASKDGRPYYFDDDHLSEYGNQRLTPMFRKFLNASPKNQ